MENLKLVKISRVYTLKYHWAWRFDKFIETRNQMRSNLALHGLAIF